MQDKLGRIAIPSHLLIQVQSLPESVPVSLPDAPRSVVDYSREFPLRDVLTLTTGRNLADGKQAGMPWSWSDGAMRVASFLSGVSHSDYRGVVGSKLFRNMIIEQASHLEDIILELSSDSFNVPSAWVSSDWDRYINGLIVKYGADVSLRPGAIRRTMLDDMDGSF